MVNESPRTNHSFLPAGYRSDCRRDGIGGFMKGLAVVLLGIALLAGPPVLGAFLNGSFDIHTPFGE